MKGVARGSEKFAGAGSTRNEPLGEAAGVAKKGAIQKD
jgi:hypothetical protein